MLFRSHNKKPGPYFLIVWAGDNDSSYIGLNVTLRECIINEKMAIHQTLCDQCDSHHFNFDPMKGTCEPCPDGCECTAWGIAPKDKHWILHPCSIDVKECLSDIACSYGDLILS